MVKIRRAIRGSFCRAVEVDGFNHYANPKKVRLTFYNLQLALPEIENDDAIMQLVRENELIFDRTLFFLFAERIEKIKKWLEEHSLDEWERTELDTEDVFKYVGENFTSDEILAMWSGKQITMPDNPNINLIPLMTDPDDNE
jgi:hypothetical protein